MKLTLILALILFLVLLFTKGIFFVLVAGAASYFAIKGIGSSGGLAILGGGNNAPITGASTAARVLL